jgi:hypothetical protein
MHLLRQAPQRMAAAVLETQPGAGDETAHDPDTFVLVSLTIIFQSVAFPPACRVSKRCAPNPRTPALPTIL